MIEAARRLAARAAPSAALAATLVAAAAATAHTPPTVPPPPPPGPFAQPAMKAFLRTRSGEITAAVYDVVAGRTFLYRAGVQADDASIAKVDILATALYEAQQHGALLSAGEQRAATGAIEESDNDDAQSLWYAVGGNPSIAAFNQAAGMTQTVLDPQGIWGHYESTALDQVRLLRHIALHNDLLSDASRAYELSLMRRIDPIQAWGVTSGVLSPATVALKNGWLPVGGGWEINSIGWVDGRGRDYLIAILTAANPGMTYGIQTVEGISQVVWDYFRPPRSSGRGI